MRIGRVTVRLGAVLQNRDDVQAAHFLGAVDDSILEAALLQASQLNLGLREHVLAVAEGQRLGLAGGDARRRHALLDAVGAAGALVDRALNAVVLRHVERAGARAVLAADALVGVHLDHTGVLVFDQTTSGTHRNARGIGAVLAAATAERPFDALAAAGFLVVGHDQTGDAVQIRRILMRSGEHVLVQARRRRQVVPALASYLASMATRAAGSIEQNCFLTHAPSPPMLSRCRRGTPCTQACTSWGRPRSGSGR